MAQPVSTREQKKLVAELLVHGLERMDAGDYNGAVDDFLRARKMDPRNVQCSVRLAQAWFQLGLYAKSSNAVKGFIGTRKATPECYQVYGNSMDMLGKTTYALRMYREGLHRFPAAGILHMEIGIVKYAQGQIDSALYHWENGIEADPWFPSDYYWAAKACDSLGDPVWATLYAELYCNMDRTSERSSEMSRLIFGAFASSLKNENGLASLELMQIPDSIPEGTKTFEHFYAEMFSVVVIDTPRPAGVDDVISWREFVFHLWVNDQAAERYRVSLLDWYREIERYGYFEAYQRWLFYDASPNEFISWQRENEGYWKSFEEWFAQHSMGTTVRTHTSRRAAKAK